MISIIIQQEPIDAARVLAEAGTDADGAVVSFIGRVRNNSREKTVTHIEYETYSEMARKQLRKIVDEAVARWSLNSCTVVHRFGRVNCRRSQHHYRRVGPPPQRGLSGGAVHNRHHKG